MLSGKFGISNNAVLIDHLPPKKKTLGAKRPPQKTVETITAL